MKKSSKSKRAWILAGAMIFGGAALISTGLATWVIGASVTENDKSIGVTVDTAKNQSLILSATLDDDKIYITENTALEDGSEYLSGLTFENSEGGSNVDENALKITFESLTISIGAATGKVPTAITFSLEADAGEETINAVNTVSQDLLGSRTNAEDPNAATSWTYLAAPTTINISYDESESNANFTKSSGSNGQTVYSLNTSVDSLKTVSFGWGTFFDGKSPFIYYTDTFADQLETMSNSDYASLLGSINSELDAMHTALDNKSLTLRIAVETKDAD